MKKYVYCEYANQVWEVNDEQLKEITELSEFIMEHQDLASVIWPVDQLRALLGDITSFDEEEAKSPLKLAKGLFIDGQVKETDEWKPYIVACVYPRDVSAKNFRVSVTPLDVLTEDDWANEFFKEHFWEILDEGEGYDAVLCMRIFGKSANKPSSFDFEFDWASEPFIAYRNGKMVVKEADYGFLEEKKEILENELKRIEETNFDKDVSEKWFNEALVIFSEERALGTRFSNEKTIDLSIAMENATSASETKYAQFYRNEFVYMLDEALRETSK